jgi:PAS domain S-box-containing protein
MTDSPIASRDDLYQLQVKNLKEYAMFLIDADGIITTWNAGVQHLFGYGESAWVGQHASLIFTPPDKAAEVWAREMEAAREQGSVSDIRWHRRKDGTEFFANGILNALRDESGELIGFAKILNDETTRKHLEDSLVESNQALEQFAYAASHDLQEPLRTISVYSQMLQHRYSASLEQDALDALQFITLGVKRMHGLIDDLLSYARVTAQHEPPVLISLDHDIESALSQLEQSIKDAGAVVTHDPLPTVLTERSQMTRLFQNLIGNSIKYRSVDRPARIHVSSRPEGSHWLISIHDNGIGFSPQFAEAIFSPFRRLHGREYPGSGVGLSICRRIVERYGGKIWAESAPGEGSTFYFTLPHPHDEAANGSGSSPTKREAHTSN